MRLVNTARTLTVGLVAALSGALVACGGSAAGPSTSAGSGATTTSASAAADTGVSNGQTYTVTRSTTGDATPDGTGRGTLTVDTAYGGDSFVIVDAATLGFGLQADEAHDIARLGVRITNAANAALGFTHPTNPDWRHISFCLFAGRVERTADGLRAGAAVAIQPGKVDRSPTGTALSARMAVLHARGEMAPDDRLTAVSLIGSTFTGRILGTTKVGETDAVLPEISGRAWITGIHQHMLDPADPWPGGYRLTDTWGAR